jgi:hypothetical protein
MTHWKMYHHSNIGRLDKFRGCNGEHFFLLLLQTHHIVFLVSPNVREEVKVSR